MSTFVVINPRSRLGQTGRRLPELLDLLRRHLGPVALRETACAGDGERLAREAAEDGATRLVVAGGDGTVSEALTGLLAAAGRAGEGDRTPVEVGLLPLGTGRDLARMLGLGGDLESAVARLASGRRLAIDVGRIRARGPEGQEVTRCFANIASFGLTGESARWLREQAERGRRHRFSYVMSGFVGLSRYRFPSVVLRLDGRVVHEGPLAYAAAANGQYFASGLRVAPEARLDDGLFDVVMTRKLTLGGALSHYGRLVRGLPALPSQTRVERGRLLEAESAAGVWIEADGEPEGRLPARFELLPRAVTVFGLPEPDAPGDRP